MITAFKKMISQETGYCNSTQTFPDIRQKMILLGRPNWKTKLNQAIIRNDNKSVFLMKYAEVLSKIIA